MNVDEINKFITEEMGLAEENEEDVAIRLYLSNDESLEIWFDKENDCYLWSNASYGYEDIFCIVNDIMKYLDDNVSVTCMEAI